MLSAPSPQIPSKKLVSEVEYDLHDFALEVSSKEIGSRILKKLLQLDAVAYVRFASVYKEFSDLDSFMKELAKVKKAHLRDQGNGRRQNAVHRLSRGLVVKQLAAH